MYGKGFLGNMTENLQADCVQSRQAGFMQCFLYHFTKKSGHIENAPASWIDFNNSAQSPKEIPRFLAVCTS